MIYFERIEVVNKLEPPSGKSKTDIQIIFTIYASDVHRFYDDKATQHFLQLTSSIEAQLAWAPGTWNPIPSTLIAFIIFVVSKDCLLFSEFAILLNKYLFLSSAWYGP